MKEKYFSIGAALLHHSRRRVLRRLKRRLVRKRERNLSDNYKCTQDMAKTSASERSLL
jgi:hypothetical protein